MNKRFENIDVGRGMVIILMVIGHLCTFGGDLFRVIFSFHMPFFFLVSGYCTTKEKLDVSFKYYMRNLVKKLQFRQYCVESVGFF